MSNIIYIQAYPNCNHLHIRTVYYETHKRVLKEMEKHDFQRIVIGPTRQKTCNHCNDIYFFFDLHIIEDISGMNGVANEP